MRFSRSEPGFLVSAAVHLGLLVFLLVHFSHEQKFADAAEAVPIETITESQFHEIMQGETTAKLAAKPRADKVADLTEAKPTPPPPPPPEAKRDVPVPPPPPRRPPEPSQADETPPTPPSPPPRPAPPTPPVAKTPPPTPPPDPRQEAEREDAETVRPPPRPKQPEKAERKPTPEPPRPPEKPEQKRKADAKPKPPKLDEVAKLLAENKDKPAPKRKSSTEAEHRRRSPDLTEIAKLLDEKAPDAKFATGREISHAAALGARHATGARMSPSMSDSLSALLQEQYKQCWNYLPLSGGKYVAKIHVAYRPDGSLAGQPTLLNPPSDPAFRGLAESAMRAVRRCNPLRIPAQYQPYYDQWKDWVVGFDPEILN